MHLIGMILSIVALALVSIEFYIEVWIKDYAAAITITNSCLYVAAGIFGYVLGNIILDTEKRRKNLKGSHLWGLCFYCFWYINFVSTFGAGAILYIKAPTSVFQPLSPILWSFLVIIKPIDSLE